ncbi:SpoIIAA family protein [Mucilaginibacter glaciei]|uniref:STAS/SEC14 domain-containing protein n=1 Tax=Mucilaginibacter glaciei TaxID=2772109 RepID=A0A926NSY5_9SPHI|nr:STAS/SEC14 domain-containing protein [Mucilaginibacter glaciei]MBD1394743.1 STAS/SEC14 domain-containing protein [Mucilaginibacter glaciei]
MLQYINDLPKHVIGIHATGEVTKQDIENVLNPRIEELTARQNEINYLLLLETDIQSWTTEAWWEDLKIGLRNFDKWNRIAVVSDQKSVEWFTDAFRFFIPGQTKCFELSELRQAIDWVSKQD